MQKSSQNWSRRRFISSTGSTGVAVLVAPLFAWSTKISDDPVSRLVTATMGIDTHNHMDVPFTKEAFAEISYDLTGEMKKSGLSALCMTFCVDRPELTKEGEAYQRFITSLDEMDVMLKANGVQRALDFADIQAAHKNHHPVVIQSVEGGHFIEGKLERISAAYTRGLRHLALMHDNQANPPIGDIYTNASMFNGLTEYGLNIIKECNKLGILIDLAHCNNEAIDDALEISSKPIIISHTGLNTQLGTNERMSKMMMPRLISKEQSKKVANAGGVIGVWTHLSDTPLEFVQNIRALADVIGTDHICIGTDTKMAPPSNANGRGGMKTNEAWQNQSEGFYYVVVDAMLKAGFNEKEIANIGGDNFCRIFDAATKGKK